MENKLISYICFQSAEEFETWQKDNPDYAVATITPMTGKIELDFQETSKHETAAQAKTTKIKTFVTYWKIIQQEGECS